MHAMTINQSLHNLTVLVKGQSCMAVMYCSAQMAATAEGVP